MRIGRVLLMFAATFAGGAQASPVTRLTQPEVLQACIESVEQVGFLLSQYAYRAELSEPQKVKLSKKIAIAVDTRLKDFILLKNELDRHHSASLRAKYKLIRELADEDYVGRAMDAQRYMDGALGFFRGIIWFVDPSVEIMQHLVNSSNRDFFNEKHVEADFYLSLKKMRDEDPGSVGLLRSHRQCIPLGEQGLPGEWYQAYEFLKQ
jgi:hypothetical protein